MLPDDRQECVVGLAFLPKKLPRVLTPELKHLAGAAGLWLVPLDPKLPLEQQEPGQSDGVQHPCGYTFDVIMHKLHQDEAWEANVEQYTQTRPHTQLLDPPAAIHATEDRALMLAAIPPHGGLRLTLGSPAQQEQPPRKRQRSEWGVKQRGNGRGEQSDSRPSDEVLAVAVPPGGATAEPEGGGSSEHVLGGALVGEGRRQGNEQQQEDEAASGITAAGTAAAVAASGTCEPEELLVTVRAPPQMVLQSREELEKLGADGAGAPLQPPLLIKTQRSDAAGDSGHGLAIAATWAELPLRAESLQQQARAAASAAGDSRPCGCGEGGGAGGGGSATGHHTVGDGPWVPLVVQQYVPHSEALYKVYVLGRHVQVTRRATLTRHDLLTLTANARTTQERLDGAAGESAPPGGDPPRDVPPPAMLHRLSAQPLTQGHGPCGAGVTEVARQAQPLQPALAGALTPPAVEGTVGPRPDATGMLSAVSGSISTHAALGGQPRGARGLDDRVLTAVAHELSRRTGLTMFNFDAVVPDGNGDGDRDRSHNPGLQKGAQEDRLLPGANDDGTPYGLQLYVVDINYFPGYDKLAGWEAQLVAHLRAAADRAVAVRGQSVP